MIKSMTKCVIATMICVLAFTSSAYAHVWVDGYYESNNDGQTHRHYYYCDECGSEYSSTESCTWQSSTYDYEEYGENGHYHVYECPYCYGEKRVFEDCSWKLDDRYYTDWSSKKHKVTSYYDCKKCYNSKTVVSYKKHVIKWVRHGSSFWYECKYCEHAPKYNGYVLIDSNDNDNVTLYRNQKYKYYMDNYSKSKNKIKSIKYSKKKICKVKRKGKNLIIKGKKRGKCRVTVKMRSGAKYVFKVRVK